MDDPVSSDSPLALAAFKCSNGFQAAHFSVQEPTTDCRLMCTALQPPLGHCATHALAQHSHLHN
eukprot:1159139-Pelagomonas_calceolata.AAC.8